MMLAYSDSSCFTLAMGIRWSSSFSVLIITNFTGLAIDLVSLRRSTCSGCLILMCLYNILFKEKCLLQIPQPNGFSPVCTRMCSLTVVLCAKYFPHILHWYGFSPVSDYVQIFVERSLYVIG